MSASHPELALSAVRRHLVGASLALACFVSFGVAQAAPPRVEPFDAQTWTTLKTQTKENLLVVFTTTWCAVCPQTFDALANAIDQRTVNARLVGVVMDRAPGEDDPALLANAHYRRTARLFAFDGQEAALRHAVDPSWRAVTPYVVFQAPGQPPRTRLGTPSAAELAQWSRR